MIQFVSHQVANQRSDAALLCADNEELVRIACRVINACNGTLADHGVQVT